MFRTVRAHIVTTALLIAAVAAGGAANAQDAAKGKIIFMRCTACHTIDGSGPRMGPDLGGVVGRKAGSVAGYDYSPAMKASRKTWDEATLSAFLAAPQAVVKGTKMAFPGLSNPADSANVIAYLKATKPAK
jgi:cytochrome c